MKNIIKSKTFWFAVAQGLIGILVVFQTAYPAIGWIAVVKSVLDVYLRTITESKVGFGN